MKSEMILPRPSCESNRTADTPVHKAYEPSLYFFTHTPHPETSQIKLSGLDETCISCDLQIFVPRIVFRDNDGVQFRLRKSMG